MRAYGMSDDDGRNRRLKQNALLLALFAVAFYVGFILWMGLHGVGSGH